MANPLSPIFNAAVVDICKQVWPQGYDRSLTKVSESFRGLRNEYLKRGRITVFCGASDNTIFDDAEVNCDFRAWHNWAHLEAARLGGDIRNFNLISEEEAYEVQANQLFKRFGLYDSRAMIKLLHAEIMGQAEYYDKHKRFVVNQRGFVESYLYDAWNAMSRKW